MAKKRKKPLNRGPKGGEKHTPGRGHDRKSRTRKDKKRVKKARQRREELEAEARRQWQVWKPLSDFEKKMRPELKPTLPEPDDAEST